MAQVPNTGLSGQAGGPLGSHHVALAQGRCQRSLSGTAYIATYTWRCRSLGPDVMHVHAPLSCPGSDVARCRQHIELPNSAFVADSTGVWDQARDLLSTV